jgi:hypothetical protein
VFLGLCVWLYYYDNAWAIVNCKIVGSLAPLGSRSILLIAAKKTVLDGGLPVDIAGRQGFLQSKKREFDNSWLFYLNSLTQTEE